MAAGFATDEDYRVFVSVGDEPPRELYRNPKPAGVGSEWPQGGGGLSPDGALVCIHHSEHGDIDRQALRVLDSRSGETAGDQVDPELRMEAVAWSPAPGARRLLFTQERTGIERPAVWDLGTRERVDLAMEDVAGPVIPQGWTLRRHSCPRAQRPGRRCQSSPHGGSEVGSLRGGSRPRGHDPRGGLPSRRRAVVPGRLERRASIRSTGRLGFRPPAADRSPSSAGPEVAGSRGRIPPATSSTDSSRRPRAPARSRRSRRSTEGPNGTTPISGIQACRRSSTKGSPSCRSTIEGRRVVARPSEKR